MNIELQTAQSEWYWSEATEMLIGGAAGPGKSFFMRCTAISWCFQIPGLQLYFFRRTFPDIEANHINHQMGFPSLLASHIEVKDVKYNTRKNTFTFSNGSRITLAHCQYEKDKFKYQGAEIHVLMIDELTHFTDAIYRYLRGRVRMVGIKIPDHLKGMFPRVVCSSNPGGIGHNWVKATFVDFAPYKTIKQAPKEEGGLMRAYYPATIKDNPKLLEDDPEYENRLHGLGSPDLVRAMLNGDWDIVAGGAIDDIWQRNRHVIEPFEIPNSWRIDRGYDWGSAKPAAAVWFAESNGGAVELRDGTERNFPKGTVFIIREVYFWNGKPNEGSKLTAKEHAIKIKEIDSSIGKVRPGPADNAIFDAENGNCIADDMKGEGVKWTRSDKSPGSRKTGLEKIRSKLKAVLKSPMEDAGLFVFSNCRHTIRTLPVLPRDEKDPDDINTDVEDHIYDVVRYRLTAKTSSVGSEEFIV